jgi:DNA-binding CsgD family transcriptional regulator
MSKATTTATGAAEIVRFEGPQIDAASLWAAITHTPGVGVSITDAAGNLLFVNDTAKLLFSESLEVDYRGKTIHDFHSREFADERLAMIGRVLQDGKPLSINHIYHGRRIQSTVWPVRDRRPPYGRAIVVSHERSHDPITPVLAGDCETISSAYIDLGPLNVLTHRELEVLVLLGHGMSVPDAAALLVRSPKTIQRHKSSISEKLGARGQADLVAIVTSIGLNMEDIKLKRLPSTDG